MPCCPFVRIRLFATLLLAAVYGKLVHGQQVTGGMKN